MKAIAPTRLMRLAPATFLVVSLVTPRCGLAADPVFSGPQPGEKTTNFEVVNIGGAADGQTRDPIAENAGAPTALVFITRSDLTSWGKYLWCAGLAAMGRRAL